MRFAILFASMNINTMLKAIAEAQGFVIPYVPEPTSSFVLLVSVIFITMDVIDFLKGSR